MCGGMCGKTITSGLLRPSLLAFPGGATPAALPRGSQGCVVTQALYGETPDSSSQLDSKLSSSYNSMYVTQPPPAISLHCHHFLPSSLSGLGKTRIRSLPCFNTS